MLFRENIHECESTALDERVRNRLTAVLLKLRLVVEELELAGAAGHEQVNHALGPGRMMARPRRERIATAQSPTALPGRCRHDRSLARDRRAIACQKRRQSRRAQPDAAVSKKVAPCSADGVRGQAALRARSGRPWSMTLVLENALIRG